MKGKNVLARQANFELLRIISMLLIIITHFWGHCVDLAAINPFDAGYVVGWVMKGISYCGFNIFVIISAYFLCKSRFKSGKIIRIGIETIYYSLSIYLVIVILNLRDFQFASFFKAIFPVCSAEYGFVTLYLGLYILSPFLNILVNKINKRTHAILCLTLFILFSLIPNVFFFSTWLSFGGGTGIVWFVVLYLVGAYIRNYIPNERIIKNRKRLILLTSVLVLLPAIGKFILAVLEKAIFGKVFGTGLFFFNNSIVVFPASIFVFLIFRTIEIKSETTNRVIVFLSKSSFAVFLIHDNKYVRAIFWPYIEQYVNLSSVLLPIIVVLLAIGIYLLCTMIDLPRRIIINSFRPVIIGRRIDDYIETVIDNKEV